MNSNEQDVFNSFILVRDEYLQSSTLGKLYWNGVFLCYTLEDAIRPRYLKIVDHTAIPSGHYPMIVSYSPRFKREMVEIKNVPNFLAIRIHGGNNEDDTSGCILVGENRGDGKIWNSMERKVTDLVKESETTSSWITIVEKL